MKKQYFKLKLKLTALIIVILLVGCGILTYQRAAYIMVDYEQRIYEQEDLALPLRFNNAMNEKNFLHQIYDVYSNVGTIDDDIGFYSMVKDSDRNTIAETQSFIIVYNENQDDKRIILLGRDFTLENKSEYIEFMLGCDKMDISGTCDDLFIYPEKIVWYSSNVGEEKEHTITMSKNNANNGTMSFEEWIGNTRYTQGSEDDTYYPIIVCEPGYSIYSDYNKQKKLQHEAKEICEEIYEGYRNGNTLDNQSKQGIFTTYIAKTGYLNKNYAIPSVYVYHPIKIAMYELILVYIIIGIVGLISIAFANITIDKNYKKQYLYELNRRRLTSGIAHELKTPVAIIRGYVENWEQYDENERNEYSKILIKETDHMSKLVGDFLELSRLEAKAKKLNLESVDLYSLTNSVLNKMKADVSIETDGLEEYLVQADLEMIRTAISNLVSNSIKYSDKMIELKLSENNGKIKFLIANDGATIDGENMGNVWDEFYKGNKNDYNRFGSDGLGLAITKNIFILHKAQYGCTSKNGRTEFWFELKKDKEE
ncbi:MAG: HAMP domain-containing histidine kinase [Lachnospira sp.]|nr:HAMP domain-containing histidine kinase [Lachnospira sp.]